MEQREKAEKPEEKKAARLNTALVWTLVAAGAAVVLAAFAGFALFGYERLYANRIFPGVRALGVRLDGLTAEEARTTLHSAIDHALTNGVRFAHGNREIALGSASVAQNDPDLSRDYVSYNVDDAVSAAVSFGRSGNPLRDTFFRWAARAKPVHLAVATTIDEAGIQNAVMKSLGDAIRPPEDARLVIRWDAAANAARAETIDEKPGKTIGWDRALARLRTQAADLRFAPIALTETDAAPTITKNDVEPLKADAEKLLLRAPFTLTFTPPTDSGERPSSYGVSRENFAGWIGVERRDGRLAVTIDPTSFITSLREIAPIETEAKKGSFSVVDGKITNFEAGNIGRTIDAEATRRGILSGIWTTSTFPIIANTIEAALTGNDPERLGIKEIVGIGTSNFAGSPTNRRKNIAIGVSKLNGVLIAPGEEFSLLKTLGAITAENGWLPELVIKGNKTIPELGGGLCQIGTTTFRTALNSGLKITERRNHSYRVSYYEPAGTDATIYEPSPDFKFVNDTSAHILIHAFMTGDVVTYEFWGTKDGRKITVGPSKITNIAPAPPKKTIETLDLPPGKTRCTETAHAGADAVLPYRVEYADGTVHEETFFSHYRPWQAVCLVGVEKLSDGGAATSTAAND